MCLTRVLKRWRTAKKPVFSQDVSNTHGFVCTRLSTRISFRKILILFWGIDLESVKDLKWHKFYVLASKNDQGCWYMVKLFEDVNSLKRFLGNWPLSSLSLSWFASSTTFFQFPSSLALSISCSRVPWKLYFVR